MHIFIVSVCVCVCSCCHSHVDERAVHHSDHRRRGQTDHLLEAPKLRRKRKTSRSMYWTILAKYPADNMTQLSDSERRLLKCAVHVQNTKQEEEDELTALSPNQTKGHIQSC